jgi:hypothetical protein
MKRERQHWKELLPIITAFANGDDVQYRSRILSESKWTNDPDPSFQCEDLEYRIVPKPRKVWINDYGKEGVSLYLSKEQADEVSYDHRIACHEIELPPLP